MATYHVLHLLEKVVGSGVNSEWFPIEKVSAYWGSNMPFGVPVGHFQGSIGTMLGFTSSYCSSNTWDGSVVITPKVLISEANILKIHLLAAFLGESDFRWQGKYFKQVFLVIPTPLVQN